MDTKAPPRVHIRTILSVLLNLAIFIQTLFSVLSYFQPEMDGTGCFMYFTVDSNILAAVVSLLLAIWELCHLRGEVPPKWMMLLKFTGTVAVGVTFFTVMLFLGPMMGYGPMVTGHNLFLHVLNPLAAMLSFALLERGTEAPAGKYALGAVADADLWRCLFLSGHDPRPVEGRLV